MIEFTIELWYNDGSVKDTPKVANRMNRQQKQKTGLMMLIILIVVAICAVLAGRVSINYSISDYLNDETDTKIALNIIKQEFGMNTDVKVMIKDVDNAQADAVADKIADIDGVMTVSFDADDTQYYKDGDALIVAMLYGDEYAESTNEAVTRIRQTVSENVKNDTVYGGAAVETTALREQITSEMVLIFAVAIALVVGLLLVMATSWLEPLILLAAAGVAILINLGTNIIMGEISYITNSVAAILQLALSIDYSIVLLHTYRQQRSAFDNPVDAMKATVKQVIRPVCASALTTLAGLAALLFMNFRIGFDIGTVLIKGIVISAIISLTFFPLLLLWTAKLLDKTAKPALKLSGGIFCRAAARFAKVTVPCFLVVIIVCAVLANTVSYTFSVEKIAGQEIEDTFGGNSSMILVYKNGDNNDEKEAAFAKRLAAATKQSGEPVLIGYTAYSNTLGNVMDAQAIAEMIGIPKTTAEELLALYHLEQSKDSVTISGREFVSYAKELLASDDYASLTQSADISLTPFIKLMFDGNEYTYPALYKQLETDAIPETLIAGVYAKYAVENGIADTAGVKATELIRYVSDTLASDPSLGAMIGAMGVDAADTLGSVDSLTAMLRKDNYSRMLITLDLTTEGDDTRRFMDEITPVVDEIFGEEAYLAGEIPSTYDLQTAFDYDNILITVFTIVSVFLIVMLIFKSLSLPIVLVAIIQGAIWLTMTLMALSGKSIFFMSYIMSTCILMGATIDYGILLSSNYITLRATSDRVNALRSAMKATIPTVFTSGSILAVAGIVIHFISGQGAISIVGLLVGVGAIISTIFVTVLLPSVLYLTDRFILALTRKNSK